MKIYKRKDGVKT